MPRLLHLADLHVGWVPRDLPSAVAEARRAARDALLDEAVALALEERVHAVLIVGDLFDSFDPPAELVRSVRDTLGRLTSAGIVVVTVPGNHDELTYGASVYRREADRWPGLLVREPMPAHLASLQLGDETLLLYGLAFVGGVTDVADALGSLPAAGRLSRNEGESSVFLAHGTLVHGAGSIRDERSLPLRRDALAAAGYDYLALGHVHRPSEQRLGRSLAVYPGCVGGKGFDDPGSDAWTLLDVSAGSARTRRRDLQGPALRDLRLDVSDCNDADEVTEALSALVARHPGDVVRVRLGGALPAVLDPEELSERCSGDALFLRVEDHTTDVSPALLDAWSASPTVRGEFVRRLRARLVDSSDEIERERVVKALRFGLDALGGRR
jgi:DNA repair protein SbcD/Mre11